MTTVQSIHRTSTVGVTATETTGPSTPTSPDDTSLMPSPGLFGGEDAMTALAAILVKADNKDRDTSRLIEDAADKSALDYANQHADALRDKADKEVTEAYINGGFQVAGGAATAASPFVPESSKWRAVVCSGKDVLPSMGTILSAGFKADATRDDATGVTLDADAQCAIRRFNAAHDDSQAATESIQKVEQFLQSVVQSENETRNAAASMLRG
jgi:hypothetical protein